jgi:hypothetical protein
MLLNTWESGAAVVGRAHFAGGTAMKLFNETFAGHKK